MSSSTSAPTPKTNLKVVFGCMTFGAAGAEQARVHDLSECRSILDIFSSHGHTELDTARMYGSGSSEEYLRELGYTTPSSDHSFRIATKCFPSARNPKFPAKDQYTFSSSDIERSINDSLSALGTDKFDLFYLHSPDRETDLEETLSAVNLAHQSGKFQRFGLSNYRSDEVEQIISICDKNNFVKPTVYQGLYNSLSRSADNLFPTLRKHNISYYAYNPLLGGLSTHTSPSSQPEEGSRFDPNRVQGQMYRARYWQQHYFDAINLIRPTAETLGLTLPEVALRWMMHHSQLNKSNGDAVIIGASSTKHIGQNLIDFEKGPLPEGMVNKVDEAWQIVKPNAPPYHH